MRSKLSEADLFRALPPEERNRRLKGVSPDEARQLLYDWHFWSRPEQLAPKGDWSVWIALAGRGWGKTRTGAEWVREEVESAGEPIRLALVARTPADARDTMIEGESGILAISPPWNLPRYEPSKRRLTWPNGSLALVFSSVEYSQLRGPQHHRFWADELCAWRYPEETWDMLQFGLRLGSRPRGIVTTTPRNLPLLKDLLARPDAAVTRGRTYDNRSNLPPAFFEHILSKYEGTRLGRQEIDAAILEDAEGALWTQTLLEANRRPSTQIPQMVRIVVAVDPPGSKGGAEAGIVVAGLGDDGEGYVLDDRSGSMSPAEWGRAAVLAFDEWQADLVLGEKNNGGDMVEHVCRTAAQAMEREGVRETPHLAFQAVHASRGKRTRAEPVAALDEQGRIHHVGIFPKLEDQMCNWEPATTPESPDRVDARVWALTELMLGGKQPVRGQERLRGLAVPKLATTANPRW